MTESEAIKEFQQNIDMPFRSNISIEASELAIQALDDFVRFASDMPIVEEEDGEIRPMRLEEMAEQLKAGVKE